MPCCYDANGINGYQFLQTGSIVLVLYCIGIVLYWYCIVLLRLPLQHKAGVNGGPEVCWSLERLQCPSQLFLSHFTDLLRKPIERLQSYSLVLNVSETE